MRRTLAAAGLSLGLLSAALTTSVTSGSSTASAADITPLPALLAARFPFSFCAPAFFRPRASEAGGARPGEGAGPERPVLQLDAAPRRVSFDPDVHVLATFQAR